MANDMINPPSIGASPPGALLPVPPFSPEAGGGGGAWAALIWAMAMKPTRIKANMKDIIVFFIRFRFINWAILFIVELLDLVYFTNTFVEYEFSLVTTFTR
jgi:hypothetical protein